MALGSAGTPNGLAYLPNASVLRTYITAPAALLGRVELTCESSVLLYSSSLTASCHSLDVFSPGISKARWANSGAERTQLGAPCCLYYFLHCIIFSNSSPENIFDVKNNSYSIICFIIFKQFCDIRLVSFPSVP